MIYNVVVNKNNEFSYWPLDSTLPQGWQRNLYSGTKDQCLKYIETILMDMTPLKLPPGQSGGSEPSQILETPIDAPGRPVNPQLLHRFFELQASRRPNSIAFVCGEASITYAELDQKANQLAHFLINRGAEPDKLIGIMVEPSLEMAIGIVGILKAGAAYVPLDPNYPVDRISYMIEDAKLDLILTQEHLSDQRQKGAACFWCLDRDWEDVKSLSISSPFIDTSPENLAYCIYTSGSTGRPKGVMISHSAILSSLLWFVSYTALTESDCMIMLASFSFDVSVSEFWPALMVGGRCIVAPPGAARDPAVICRLLIDQRVSILLCVPSLLANILPRFSHSPSGFLRHVFSGGEALTSELRDEFFRSCGAELHNGYGPSETAIHAVCNRCVRDQHGTVVPIGRPIEPARISILNQNLHPVALGETGEIFIGGRGLARGYLNRPALTAERFVPDPAAKDGERLYRTGDLGYFLPDGSIVFVGRADNQVKIRGHRIELGEIEAACSSCPGIHQAAAVVCGAPSNPQLVVFFTPHPNYEMEALADQLKFFLQAKMPSFMLPSHIVALPVLPLSPNGKIDRKWLSEQPLPMPERQSSARSPKTPLEKQLTEVMGFVLNVSNFGPDDNFFSFGGNSLLVMRFVQELENISGYVVSPATVYGSPTPAILAAFIETEGSLLSANHIVTLSRGEARKPLFFVHGEDGRLGDFIHLPRFMKQGRPIYGLRLGPLEAKISENLPIEMLAERFVTEILKVCPNGNCWVGGYSFGGPLAFEICHRLRRESADVGLILIDAFPVTRLSGIRRRLGNLMRSAREGKLFAEAVKRVTRDRKPLSSIDKEYEERRNQLEKNLKRYKYFPYEGNVVFIQCDDPGGDLAALNKDGMNGWSRLLKGKVEIAQVKGRHSVFLRKPMVANVAEQLEQKLAIFEQEF